MSDLDDFTDCYTTRDSSLIKHVVPHVSQYGVEAKVARSAVLDELRHQYYTKEKEEKRFRQSFNT